MGVVWVEECEEVVVEGEFVSGSFFWGVDPDVDGALAGGDFGVGELFGEFLGDGGDDHWIWGLVRKTLVWGLWMRKPFWA